MARIEDANPKNSSGGYNRTLGDPYLARLIQKVQSTVIKNGNDLEMIIAESCEKKIENLDDFVKDCNRRNISNGVYLCEKRVLRESENFKLKSHEPDFLVLILCESDTAPRVCHIVELKDGSQFDTKKSKSEHERLEEYAIFLGPRIPFAVDFYICCFNENDKDVIKTGLKNEFALDEILTGRDFCDLIGIDYESVVTKRKESIKDNLLYFSSEAAKVSEIRSAVNNMNSTVVYENDFYPTDDE